MTTHPPPPDLATLRSRSMSECVAGMGSLSNRRATGGLSRSQRTPVQGLWQRPKVVVRTFKACVTCEVALECKDSSTWFTIFWAQTGQAAASGTGDPGAPPCIDRARMCTRSWLAAEATNRLGSPCKEKIVSTAPGVGSKKVRLDEEAHGDHLPIIPFQASGKGPGLPLLTRKPGMSLQHAGFKANASGFFCFVLFCFFVFLR